MIRNVRNVTLVETQKSPSINKEFDDGYDSNAIQDHLSHTTHDEDDEDDEY